MSMASDAAANLAARIGKATEAKQADLSGGQAAPGPLPKRVAELVEQAKAISKKRMAEGLEAARNEIQSPSLLPAWPMILHSHELNLLGLAESIPVILEPFEKPLADLRNEIAEALMPNAKSTGYVPRFSNEFARNAELEKEAAKLPGYLAAKAEVAAIEMALARIRLELAKDRESFQVAKLLFERETAKLRATG